MNPEKEFMERNVFLEDLRKLGVGEGMNLMVHSSMRNIGANSEDFNAAVVIDCLLELIGPDGTLMAPTITGGVRPDQPVFHQQHSPSTVGHFTNVLRLLPGAARSLHPVHSVAAVGPRARFFTEGHIDAGTPWSPGTPYGRLLRDDKAAILFLGVDLTYNSCFHALEIEAMLPGMHTRESTVLHVIDKEGGAHEVVHHWHHPATKRFFSDVEYVLRDAGCLRWGRTGLGISRLGRAVRMRDVILKLLKEEPWLMTRPPGDNDFVWEP